MSRNLERERARRAWAQLVWERTHNVSGAGRQRNRDGGGKKSYGVNAVMIRPNKAKKKQLGGEPYGGNGKPIMRNWPWTPLSGGAQDLRTLRRGNRS